MSTLLRRAARGAVPVSVRERLRHGAYAWLPPALLDRLRRARREWRHLPEGWEDPAAQAARGWDAEGVADAYTAGFAAYRAAVRPIAPLGVPSEVHPGRPVPNDDLRAHNLVMTVGYVLARAAVGVPTLSVLDWGGGLGQLAVLARELLPDVELEYHCQEVPRVAAAGARANPTATFRHDGEWPDRRFDVVVADCALQYAEDWRSLLTQLAHASRNAVFLARVPLAIGGGAFVALQRPRRYSYGTEYAGWVFDRAEFLVAAASAGLRLEREFIADEGWTASGAPSTTESRSFLFRV